MKSDTFYDPVYDISVMVIYSEDNENEKVFKKAAKFINRETECKKAWDALCFSNNEDSLYVLAFTQKNNNIPYLINLITHETEHLMCEIFKSRGIKLSTKIKRQEVQAYYKGFLANQTALILEKI